MDGLQLYSSIFENLHEGIYFVDKERKITFWNHGAEILTGFSSSDVLDKYCFENILAHTDVHGNQLCFGGCPLHKSIWENKIHNASVFFHHKEGYRVPVSVKTIPISEGEEVIGAVEIFQVQNEDINFPYDVQLLKELALKDQLTNMPNRRYIETFLKSKINEHSVLGIDFGILFMDLDNFKQVNDIYGHDTGDEILKVLSKTFSNNMRSSDLIGRWGGEEFLGVFVCHHQDILYQIAEKIRLLIEKSSILVNMQPVNVTLSIGATMYIPLDSLESIVKRADSLLYISKRNGKNQVTIE